MNQYPRLIVQIDSIGRVGHMDDLRVFDYLYLDEFKSLIRYLCCDNLKGKRREVVQLLQYYIQTAKRVMILDADFTPDMKELIVELSPNAVITQKTNTFKSDTNQYFFTTNQNDWFAKLQEIVKLKKKIAIPVNSKEESERIKEFILKTYPNATIGLINAEIRGKERKELFDIKNWKDLDYLIYSPTITCGVSFDEIHFDYIFGYCVSESNTAQEFVQQLRRIRKTTSNDVYLYISPTRGSLLTDYDTIHRTLLENYQFKISQEGHYGINTKISTKNHRMEIEEDFYFKMFMITLIERNKSRNNMLNEVLLTIKKELSENSSIQKFGVEMKSIKEDLLQTKEKINQERIQRILNAKCIAQDDYQKLKKSQNPTSDQLFQIEKFEIMEFYKINEITLNKEFVEEFGKKHIRDEFDMFDIFMNENNPCEKVSNEFLIHSKNPKFKRDLLFKALKVYGMNDIYSQTSSTKIQKINTQELNDIFHKIQVEFHQSSNLPSFKSSDVKSLVDQLKKILKMMGLKLQNVRRRTQVDGESKRETVYFIDLKSLKNAFEVTIQRNKGNSTYFNF